MGQLSSPTPVSIILTATDRLVAANADGGLNPAAAHVILLGEAAGANLNANDIIALGFNALDAGLSGANAAGTIAIGRSAWSSLTSAAAALANTGIGRNAAANLGTAYGMVVIGDSALAGPTGLEAGRDTYRSVVIGVQAGSGTSAVWNQYANYRDSVVIGYNADRRTTVNASIGSDRNQSVIIGSGANSNAFAAGSNAYQENVVIGYNANAGGGAQLSVIIGSGATSSGNASGGCTAEVIIGRGASTGGANASNNVAIGFSAGVTGGSQNVVIGSLAKIGLGSGNVSLGYTATSQSTQAGNNNTALGSYTNLGTGTAAGAVRNIIIGCGAGRQLTGAATADTFVMETLDGAGAGTLRRMFFGTLNNGNLVIGNAANGDLNWRGTTQPTNAVKLVNGTQGAGTNPTNGGFFYVDTGVLRWLDQNGLNTALSARVTTVGALGGASQGDRAIVTDALAPAWNTPVVGGGAIVTPVYYNGAAWTAG